MKKKLTLTYEETTPEQLNAADRSLIERSKEAAEGSYAPYSSFNVGCAIRLSDGTITSGANQENASYPCGTCAERTTLFYTEANHPGATLTDIAIAAKTHGHFTDTPLPPCGLCRQALLEAEERQNSKLRILMYGEKKVWIADSVSELLPLRFDAGNME
jgi:cytidine deaminase